MPRAIIFDLDGTLAESKSALSNEMGLLIKELLTRMPVAVTSGASLAQCLDQFVAHIPKDANLANLYLLPTSGAALYVYADSSWQKVYAETLTDTQMADTERVIEHALQVTNMALPDAYGPRIERREQTQIAFSAVGQKAPIEVKREWDPDQKKRRVLVEIIAPLLPWAEVRMGGMTTIDITRKGIDKRYGVEHLSQRLGIPVSEMLYVGDALYPGGNDEIVIGSGIQTKAVKNPSETKAVIESVLAAS